LTDCSHSTTVTMSIISECFYRHVS